MKTHELRSLQALRKLREQRAANQLVAQQQRCQQTSHALDLAKERLHLHRENLAREAQQIYASLTEGLSVISWQDAQARLSALANGQQQMETGIDEVEQTLETQKRERETFRLERMTRQRQCEAWDMLLGRREHTEQRAAEHLEDADEGLLMRLSASVSGTGQ
jgi:hypothetical protein